MDSQTDQQGVMAGAISFPRFSDLPIELRKMVWKAALEETEAGICIPGLEYDFRRRQPDVPHDGENYILDNGENDILDDDDTQVEQLIVNYKLPALFHVCRESRRVAGQTVSTWQDGIWQDGPGPYINAYRRYEPDRDTLFLTPEASHIGGWVKAPKVQHLAFEYPYNEAQILHFMTVACERDFVDLRSVTLVDIAGFDVYSSPPSRRYEFDEHTMDDWSPKQRVVCNSFIGMTGYFFRPSYGPARDNFETSLKRLVRCQPRFFEGD
ncbi:hypothetical protein GGR54DRAFT_27370 [Hypoxylon sp. NC1633]|nr:hypothetical protein GGR54DRAFT_27370 [Hypoxylon sp. NC1633]